MASVKRVQVTFDCAHPRAVAEFWKAVLGYVDPPTPPGFDSWDAFDASLPVDRQGSVWACQDPDGVGPRLFFQRVPESKTVKNRVHLDVRVGGGLTGEARVAVLEEEGARLEALGARRVRLLVADEENESCLVMQDVEGNEFCLAGRAGNLRRSYVRPSTWAPGWPRAAVAIGRSVKRPPSAHWLSG